MKWSAKVRLFRQRYKLTQADLANEIGVHVRSIRWWETSRTEPIKATRTLFERVARRYSRRKGGPTK